MSHEGATCLPVISPAQGVKVLLEQYIVQGMYLPSCCPLRTCQENERLVVMRCFPQTIVLMSLPSQRDASLIARRYPARFSQKNSEVWALDTSWAGQDPVRFWFGESSIVIPKLSSHRCGFVWMSRTSEVFGVEFLDVRLYKAMMRDWTQTLYCCAQAHSLLFLSVYLGILVLPYTKWRVRPPCYPPPSPTSPPPALLFQSGLVETMHVRTPHDVEGVCSILKLLVPRLELCMITIILSSVLLVLIVIVIILSIYYLLL